MKTLLLLLVCSLAHAQTLDYTGSLMTGSAISQDPTGQLSTPITGFYTAEIVLQNSVLMSYSAQFNESNGTVIPLDGQGGGFVDTGIPGYGNAWSGPTGDSIHLTDQGAAFYFRNTNYNAWSMTVDLGSGTDAFSFTNDHGPSGGDCGANQGAAMLCSISATGASGTWAIPTAQIAGAMAAPEIDPNGGIATFLLLAGGLAVIRGRR